MTWTRFFALLLAVHLALSPLAAQQAVSHHRDYRRGPDNWPNFWRSYQMPEVPYIVEGNSPRLEELIHDGKLYLSLSDAIALALENNLDVAVSRFTRKFAEADVLRAKTGGSVFGSNGGISTASTGASSTTTSGVAGRGSSSGRADTGATSAGGGTSGASGGINLDPVLFANFELNHQSQPTFSDFATGTNFLVNDDTRSSVTVAKSFLTGASGSLTWFSSRSFSNNLRSNFNPNLNSQLTLNLRQPLMQGFGVKLNTISMRVARNNLDASDLQFKLQVISTVSQIQRLYWDLVRIRAEVDSSGENLRLSQRLYEDNRERLEIGKLAPIDLIESEAEVGLREQQLTLSLSAVREQEATLKTALSKNGLASPSLADVEVIPTDQIEVPETLKTKPLTDLMHIALTSRPDIAHTRIQLENADIQLEASRDSLLPSLDFVAGMTNSGLAGQVNPNLILLPGEEPGVPDFFIGGFGRSLEQVFRRNFPDYSVGLQLNIPLRNRRAQADVTRALLSRRQRQLQIQQDVNTIRNEVTTALVRLEQAHARYKSATATRELREKMLDGEEQRFRFGYQGSTTFLVVQRQRQLAESRAQEILAQSEFVIARTELDRVTGQTLAVNNISLDEAYEGRVAKRPDPIPISR